MSQHYCLRCGDGLDAQLPQIHGHLVFDEFGPCFWKEKEVHLATQEKKVLKALLNAKGRGVLYEAITNVIYDFSEKTETMDNNIATVYICKLRAKFRAVDPSFGHIESSGKGGPAAVSWARWLP
jgi:DNA-binding response OmpR family regulator